LRKVAIANTKQKIFGTARFYSKILVCLKMRFQVELFGKMSQTSSACETLVLMRFCTPKLAATSKEI
jgi:hypothetical protein